MLKLAANGKVEGDDNGRGAGRLRMDRGVVGLFNTFVEDKRIKDLADIVTVVKKVVN